MQFVMCQHHKWSYQDLERMLPWQRTLYIEMLAKHLNDVEKARAQQQQQQ